MTNNQEAFLWYIVKLLRQKRVCREDAATLIEQMLIKKERTNRYSFRINGKTVVLPE